MTPPKGKIFPENPLKNAKYHPKNAIFSKNSLSCLEFMKKTYNAYPPPPHSVEYTPMYILQKLSRGALEIRFGGEHLISLIAPPLILPFWGEGLRESFVFFQGAIS